MRLRFENRLGKAAWEKNRKKPVPGDEFVKSREMKNVLACFSPIGYDILLITVRYGPSAGGGRQLGASSGPGRGVTRERKG